MKLVVDTNVFISGVFFTGPPSDILNAWRHGKVQIVISPEIMEEHQATGQEPSSRHPDVEITPWIELVATLVALWSIPLHYSSRFAQMSTTSSSSPVPWQVVSKYVVTGDKALLATSGFRVVTGLTPRQFIDEHL